MIYRNHLSTSSIWTDGENLSFEKVGDMIAVKIKSQSVLLPKERVEKIILAGQGSVTHLKNNLTIPALRVKDAGILELKIKTTKGKTAATTLRVTHFNTELWKTLSNFISHLPETMTIVPCGKENTVMTFTSSAADNNKEADGEKTEFATNKPEEVSNYVSDFINFSQGTLLVESKAQAELLAGQILPTDRIFDFSQELNLNLERKNSADIDSWADRDMLRGLQRQYFMNMIYYDIRTGKTTREEAREYYLKIFGRSLSNSNQ